MAPIPPPKAANYKPKPRPPPPKPPSPAGWTPAVSVKVTLGSVRTLIPPLVIAEGDLDRALGILEGCVGEVG